jgi:hypothetical protein
MEDQFIKITQSSDYKESCSEDYSEYYQLHILSYSKVVSSYYKKTVFDFDILIDELHSLLKTIKKKSTSTDTVKLYERDGIFLITDSDELINYIELSEFEISKGCYEYIQGIDLFDFLEGQPVDIFIKNALTTVGAASLIEQTKPFLAHLRKEQIRIDKMMQDYRDEDKVSPKYLVEIYKIEKNYKPIKMHELKCATVQSAQSLREIRLLTYADNRTVSIIKEIATGKTIEESLEQAIESIKNTKWQKRNPSVIDLDAMQRMDLDSNDPDFISYDDYVANDDELEEGDEGYEPRF